MQFDKVVKSRKSVRRYSEKKPDWRKVIRAIDSARYAPIAGNLFITKFILIQDKKIIEKLAIASQQDFVSSAHYVIAVVSEDYKLERNFGERGKIYSRQQAGAAIENVLLALNSLDLASCWIGAFDENNVKLLLKVPDNCTVDALITVGIATKIPTSDKHKTELENILFFDKYNNRFMEPKTRVSFNTV